jgi:hypothetical protein
MLHKRRIWALTWHFVDDKLAAMNSDQNPLNPMSSRPTQTDNAASTSRVALRGIWVAIILLAALMASVITCAVLLSTGAPLAAVMGAPGALFISLVSLGVTVLKFLTE